MSVCALDALFPHPPTPPKKKNKIVSVRTNVLLKHIRFSATNGCDDATAVICILAVEMIACLL